MSRHARAIPAAFFSAPWYRGNSAQPRHQRKVLPPSVFNTLSERGQQVAAEFAAETEQIVAEWSPDWDTVARLGDGGEADRLRKTEEFPKL